MTKSAQVTFDFRRNSEVLMDSDNNMAAVYCNVFCIALMQSFDPDLFRLRKEKHGFFYSVFNNRGGGDFAVRQSDTAYQSREIRTGLKKDQGWFRG